MTLEGDALSVREGMKARDKMAPTLGQGVGVDAPPPQSVLNILGALVSSSAGTRLLTS